MKFLDKLKQLVKKGVNKSRANIQGGSTDKQGNYYSPETDEKLAARQTFLQQAGRPQPKVQSSQYTYTGQPTKSKPRFVEILKSLVKPSPTVYKETFVQPTPTPSIAQPTPTPTPNLKEWENYKVYIANKAKAEGFNPNVIVSQKAIESARGNSKYAKERNNYGGVGAYDSNPDNAFTYASPEAYLDSYFKLIKTKYPKAYKVRSNPEEFARELKKGGYASDPEYVWKLLNTPEFRAKY